MRNQFVSLSILATTASIFSSVENTNAALMIDLRFTDGTKFHPWNSSNDPITINAWAVVTGGVGNANEEGLQSAIFGIRSFNNFGGAGGITSASLATGWAGSGSATGVATNTSLDGIGDWGNLNNTPLTLGTTFFRVRTSKSSPNQIDYGNAASPSGSVFNTLADGGTEFLVGSFVFTPTSSTGMVSFAPITVRGGTVAPAGWWEDSTDTTAVSPNGAKLVSTGNYGPTGSDVNINGVTIGIPEPTSLGLVGLTGLIFHRRKRLK